MPRTTRPLALALLAAVAAVTPVRRAHAAVPPYCVNNATLMGCPGYIPPTISIGPGFSGWNPIQIQPITPIIPTAPVTPAAPVVPVTTTPEPSTWALLGGGLIGVAGVARRRRRAA